MIFGKRKKKKEDDDEYLSDVSETAFSAQDLADQEIEEELADYDGDQDIKSKDDPEEIAKNLIFEIEGGCPICHKDVRGNDHYKFFCEHCNLLFERKDILEKEFGKNAGEVTTGVRKTQLTADEKKELAEKRKGLKDKIFSAFSEKKKEAVETEIDAKDEIAEEKDIKSNQDDVPEQTITQNPEEPIAQHEEAELVDAEEDEISEDVADEDETVETSVSQDSQGVDLNDVVSALGMSSRRVEDAEFEEDNSEEIEDSADEVVEDSNDTEDIDEDDSMFDEDTEESDEDETESYELEPGKIIASTQSSKLHEGSCHFVKKIHPENRIYYDSIEEGAEKGYELCVCLRRIVAKQRAEQR